MVLNRSKQAFTMLEMLVVVSLIGFLFAFCLLCSSNPHIMFPDPTFPYMLGSSIK